MIFRRFISKFVWLDATDLTRQRLEHVPMTTCPDRSKLTDYLGDALSGEERRVVEEHVETCDPCNKLLEELADADARERTPLLKNHARPDSRNIGPYKLLQRIGHGGMGTVWMAEQESPVRRRVALKLVKSEVIDKQIIARFEAERQALAMMNHQNIAKVLDAGTSEDGRPYFVMELVQGIPFSEYCDKNKLALNERLELFISVCRAVQHAHQKGIIHRDLKPGNVLVTLYDGKPVPKVIDFGLAKALQHQTKLTDKTLFTEFNQVVGTVQYMSPEQAEMNALDVDTRTDIYSLGVMLYELLTGSTPIDRETAKKEAILKLLEWVREKEPPRPSVRLSDSGDAIKGISQQRQIEPSKLQQLLRGDLDWIAMKALEKDRTRRYNTADGLAEDIERYLRNEAIEARPPSLGYRLQKTLRKNRVAFVMAATVLLLLVAGIAGTTSQWIRYQNAAGRESLRAQEALSASELAETKKNEAESANAQLRVQTSRALAAKVRATDLLYANTLSQAIRARDRHDDVGFWSALASASWPQRGWEHDYLYSTATLWPDKRLRTASVRLTHLDSSVNGRFLGGLQNGTLSIWEMETGNLYASLGRAACFEFSPDSRFVCVGHHNGLQLHNLVDRDAAIESIDIGHRANMIRYFPDGERVVVYEQLDGSTGSETGEPVRIWNLKQRNLVAEVTGKLHGISSIDVSPDSKRVAIAGRVGPRARGTTDGAEIWDVDRQEFTTLTESLRGASISGPRIRFLSSGDVVVASGSTIYFFNAADGTVSRTTVTGEADITSLRVSRDSKHLLTAKREELKVWNVNDGAMKTRLVGYEDDPHDGVFLGATHRIAGIGRDGSLSIYDLENHEKKAAATAGVRSLTWSNVGEQLVVGETHAVRILDTTNARETRISHDQGPILVIAISPDDNRIACGHQDQCVSVWNVKTGDLVWKHTDLFGPVSGLAFSKDGNVLISAEYEGHGTLWRSSDGELIKRLPSEAEDVVAVAPDGSYFVSSELGHISKFSMDGAPFPKSAQSVDRIQAIAFAKDGRRFAVARFSELIRHGSTSSSASKQITLWDAESLQILRSLGGHTGRVRCISYSPDNKRLVSGAGEGNLRFWNPATGVALLSLDLQLGPVSDLAFSADGKSIAVAVGGNVEILRADRRQRFGRSDAIALNLEAWQAVRSRNANEMPWEDACEQAELVCKHFPTSGYLNTLGVAQYRCGKYQDAIRTLRRNETTKDQHPIDHAVLSLSYLRLGNREAAAQYRQRFDELVSSSLWRYDPDTMEFKDELKLDFGDDNRDERAEN